MKEESSSNLVSIFPDPLIINQFSSSNNYESNLNLTNNTNSYVVYKIKCNKNKLYTIKPGTSFIPPKETVNVLIKRFEKEEDKSKMDKDKLLLIFYTINKVINNNDEAKEAFKTNIFNEDSKQETKISIILQDQEPEEPKPKVFDNIKNSLKSNITSYETVLENVGDNYDEGIKEFNVLNEELRKEGNTINQKIKDYENILKMIETQKKLKNDKDNAMKDNKSLNKSGGKNNIRILALCIALLGLLTGANLANIYNLFFNSNPNPVVENLTK